MSNEPRKYITYAPWELVAIDRMQGPLIDESFCKDTQVPPYEYCRYLEYAWCLARVPQYCHVVDVGCGSCHFAAYLAARKHCIVIAIDHKDYTIAQKSAAQRWDARFEFKVSDGSDIAAESRDCVTCISSLEHNGDFAKVNAPVIRMLKHGGTALYTVPFAYGGHRYEGQHYLSFQQIMDWIVTPQCTLEELDFVTHNEYMPAAEFCNASRAAVALVRTRKR